MTPSRRALMYLIIAVQLAIMAFIVASQEMNIALDSGTGVEVELAGARASKDPFRGAHVSGHSALDLDGRAAAVPARPLHPGEHVLVFFSVEEGRRPRISRVERRRRGGDPLFSRESFSIPGRVRGADGERWSVRSGGLIARVGQHNEPVELELPASIPVANSSLQSLTGTGVVRASLRHGFLGHRYLTDVRLVGRGWAQDSGFAYDAARERLVVLAPRAPVETSSSNDPSLTSDVFLFDGLGQQVGSVPVSGRLIDGVVDQADGSLLALVSDQAWGTDGTSLTRIGADGRVLKRGPPVDLSRAIGFDPATGGVWMLTQRQAAPYSIERLTLDGPRGPRLGPFESVPRPVLSRDGEVWVVETARHRVTRLDLASGRALQEYRDLNGPLTIAVEAGSLFAIEAERTQLSKLATDGRIVWRVPRFHNLSWIIPEPGTGGAWVGAGGFEAQERGVYRVAADGTVTRTPATVSVGQSFTSRSNARLGTTAVRDSRHGRLYVQEPQAIVILGADGALLKRVDSFRLATAQPIRR
ncbi:MAG TPA: hypothetical protein VK548_18935 [Candidatus Acidoferrum sp.]|nr:hypothetical protein [Candidatus Acidoferrum sp.]